jgi:hypothetical protein
MACHHPRILVLGLLLVSLLGTLGTASCEQSGFVYGLTADSEAVSGCFPPLDCPAVFAQSMSGTFRLTEVPFAAPSLFDTFLVSDVYWLMRLGGEDLPITGSGLYTRGVGSPSTHRLQLVLRVGDQELEDFDSGLVEAGGEFPAIDIRISMNGEQFVDTVIDVRAIRFPANGGS